MVDWTEKYRPSTLQEVRGNNKARDALREWAESWDDHGTAAIVHGSPGVGKTSAAHALANDMGWEAVEVNASDSRRKDDVERYLGRAARNTTLGGATGRQLIIVDEADSFHGSADRGGAAALTRVVKDADQPMVLIANDYYEMSSTLRNACEEIEFRDVGKRSIVPVLRDVCRKEGIEYTDAALDALADKNAGDLRSAINDLQALAEVDEQLTEDDVITGDRDRTTGIFDFLDEVIKEADAETALKASYAVDETPDDLLDWIEENVPKDYDGDELAVAYDFLSNADRWLGRVRATQEYSYWRYASDNMTAGVAAARQEPKGGWTRYGRSSYVQKYWRSSGTRQTRDYVARQIAEHAGTSIGTARREILPFLAELTHHCRNRELTIAMAARYDLDPEHVSFVTGSGEDTNKVQNIVEEAQELREQSMEEHSGGAFENAVRDAAEEGDGESETESESDDGQATLMDAGSTDGDEDDEPAEEDAAEDDEDQATLGDWG
jgi:replication factor C large subunit